MRAGIVVNVTRADRDRLDAIVSDRSAPQKHVWRANIILATAEGCGTAEIMRRSGKSKPRGVEMAGGILVRPIKAATGCEFEAATETGRVMQTGLDLGYEATTTGDLPWHPESNILTNKSPCEPNPGARPHPAGFTDETGPRRDDDARLQTSRHHDAVRSSQHP
jgi:hypothetical protein